MDNNHILQTINNTDSYTVGHIHNMKKSKALNSHTTITLSGPKVNFEKILHPETLTDTQLGASVTVAMT